jgi:O-antigen ligase
LGADGAFLDRKGEDEIGMKALAMPWDVPAGRSVATARFLLLGLFVTMLVSTSVSIGFEFAAYLAFAILPELHRRLRLILRHPLMVGLVVFMAPIAVGAFYGPASWYDSLTALLAWRRMLLLPLALAVFDDEPSKRAVLRTVLAVCAIGAIVSFVTTAGHIPVYKWGPGIVFRNYATQGLTLSVGMIVALAALMRADLFKDDRVLGNRSAMAAVLVLFVLDIVYVLPGRSGYVSVLVMGLVVVALLAHGSWRTKLGLGLAVAAVLGVMLASSQQSRERIAQAVNEMRTADLDLGGDGTSLGARVVFWRNTVRMIADHPVFGVGTGGFQDGYRPYVEGVPGWHGTDTGDPHNQFLKFLGEQGIVGLAAVLFFLYRAVTCPAPAPYRQMAIAVVAGWCATSMANSHFSTFVEGRMLYFWLGAMLAGVAMLRKQDTATT